MHLLLLFPLLAPVGDLKPLTLPDGPAAKAWAGVGTETQAATLPAESAPWSEEAAWKRWAHLVGSEAPDSPAEAARRAELCLLARNHGRARDAWRHYQALGAHPEWVAAITPSLLPGVPSGTAIGAGGVPAALPDGVLLTPFLPPSSGTGPAGQIEWRTATCHRLRIGDAVIDLSITVESTGVEVDLTHVEGRAATVRILLPEPEGFAIRIEYVDWMRREDSELRTPIQVEMLPGEEAHQLFGRVIEHRSNLPTGAAKRLPAAMLEGGLTFEVPPDDPDRALVAMVAETTGGLLGIETRVRERGETTSGWTGMVFGLPSGPERDERLRFLVSAIEAFLLEPDE